MQSEKKVGLIINYIAQAVHIASGLIYTPIMLNILGQSEYGLYQLVSSIVSYLSLFSLGFTSSYIRFYARYKIKNDDNGLASLNGLFMTLFCGMAILCILCGIFMIGNIELFFGNGLTVTEYKKVRVLLLIMVFAMAISFPNSVLECQITANEKFVFLQFLDLLQKILNPFITLPCLFLGFGSVGVVLVSFVLTISKFLINIYFCRSKLQVRFSFKSLDVSLLREVSGFTIFIFINQVVDQINWNLDKLLLGRMRGSTSVAVYGVSSTIYTMYTNFANSIKNVFVPQVNLTVAKGNSDNEVTDLFVKVGRIQLMLILLVFTGFLCFGKNFIDMWAGEEYSESYYITLLLMAPMIIPLSQCLGVEIQRAKNKHQMRTIVYTIMAALNVALSVPLIKICGAVGAAIGTAIAVVLGNCIFMNFYYHKCIGIDMFRYWKSVIRFVPSAVISMLLGLIIRKSLKIESWFTFMAAILIYSALYLLVMWIITLNKNEKQIFKNFVRKSINVIKQKR